MEYINIKKVNDKELVGVIGGISLLTGKELKQLVNENNSEKEKDWHTIKYVKRGRYPYYALHKKIVFDNFKILNKNSKNICGLEKYLGISLIMNVIFITALIYVFL